MVKTGKEERKEVIIYTSLIIDYEKKMIAEQIFKDGKTQFCIYTKNSEEKIEYKYEIEHNNIKHRPMVGEEIYKKAILLPTEAKDYGTDDELDNEIKEFITKWLDVPEDFLQFALWNIKRSWVYERFHTLNYLRALGDTGQGKSRFLDALGYLHYKPIATSGATTAAPIFRIIDKWRGTIIMDEADFQKSDESQDIIKIINQGYEKGRFIMRCDKENKNRVNFFDPFCPKILATRKTFTDKAVEGRCITQVMTGTSRKNIKWNLNQDFWDKATELRNKLLMWRFRNFFKINPDKEVDFDLGDIEPRVQQIVNSFISLFSNDEKKLEIFKKFITNYQAELIDERQNSWEGMIVGGLHELLEEGQTDICAADIIERKNITNKEGKLVSARSLSSALKSLGFGKSKPKKVEGKTKRCIPIIEEHISNLFKRYGYAVTEITINTDTGENNNEGLQTELGGIRIARNLRNRVTDSVTGIIHQSCHICGYSPSADFDNSSQGKPICSKCLDFKQKQKEMEETIK